MIDPYSAETRRRFFAPGHVGDAAGARVLFGDAAESRAGARLRLSAAITGDKLLQLRFRAFGCPHLIAAAEWMCERFEGQAVPALASFPVAECMQALDVPVEKTGRILLLEDAARALANRWQATSSTDDR